MIMTMDNGGDGLEGALVIRPLLDSSLWLMSQVAQVDKELIEVYLSRQT
jgi:hypothetical protein